MRFVLLAIFVLLTAQPLPVVACDMHGDQETPHSPAGAMHDGPMDLDAQAMDCCGQDPEKTGDGCSSLSHCGACPAGLVALTPSASGVGIGPVSQQYLPNTDAPLNRTASPPFRPPIA